VLAVTYSAARLLSTAVFFPGLPGSTHAAFATLLQIDRLAFLPLLLFSVYRGVSRRTPALTTGLTALVLGSVGLFASEVGMLGIPGIWFPWGVGVSRTEYAYAAFDIALFLYLLTRLWRFVPKEAVHVATAE
jgi:hypothetical protein